MKRISRRSKSEKLTSTAKSNVLRLAGCALIVSFGAGCKWYGDLWKDYGSGQEGTPPAAEGTPASGVDVFNCIVTNPPSKLGIAYTVFWRLNEEQTWHQFVPGQIQPLAPDQSCSGTDIATLDAYGAVTHLTFNQAGTWHIRWITVDFGDAYGQVGQCNSYDGKADGCSSSQYGDATFSFDASAPTKTIQL